jgi:hypothetical protein
LEVAAAAPEDEINEIFQGGGIILLVLFSPSFCYRVDGKACTEEVGCAMY